VSYLMLLVTALLLAANGFFVAVEFALMGSRRPRMERLAAGGSRRARLALLSMSDLQRQFAGARVGITMASLALGFVAESALSELIGDFIRIFGEVSDAVVRGISYTIALALVILLHRLLGEMVPKNLAIAGPERAALWLAPPHRVFVAVFRPVIWALYATAVGVVKLFGLDPQDELGSAHTAKEFLTLFRTARDGGLVEEFQHALLVGAVHFRERRVGSIMTERADLVAVPAEATVAEIEQVMFDSGFSRVPVLGADIDDVVGFVHAKDLLPLSTEAAARTLPADLVRDVLDVAPDVGLEDLLLMMRRERLHLAVVQDDAGDTLGIVTLEDVVEELVGDIHDETDPQPVG
jgi:CBS domain containing-hemolysin-like protein